MVDDGMVIEAVYDFVVQALHVSPLNTSYCGLQFVLYTSDQHIREIWFATLAIQCKIAVPNKCNRKLPELN